MDNRLSRDLTRILRHQARDLGVKMDSNGWVNIDDLVKFLKRTKTYVTREKILDIVEYEKTQKERFQINDTVTMVRATQGHSIEGINSGLRSISLEEASTMNAVHGTKSDNVKMILASGLSRMNRIHIHMIDKPPENGEVKSGYRKSCNTLIWVNMVEAIKSGIEFFQSVNGVILSPGNAGGVIPSKYFLKITYI